MKQGTKYYPLYQYLVEREKESSIELSFDEVETILGESLPASARRSRSWWANARSTNRVQAAAWMEAGYRVTTVDLAEERVVFGLPEPFYRPTADPRQMEWTAEMIRALRMHMGLSQQELASRLNMRQQTISEWETGLYRPRGGSVALLNLIAERAGFYDFLRGEEED